ncbi:serine/threonine-protein kinase PknD [Mycobacterium noviomagense]|uniref:non-specific serine/threonine protein kinase n=1 Tax=Mycobacterium noviomagense TaxID=459858 RepID=A0A7I7PC81_9MYCO|nr:serine/threonine-protein kinase PknD [Mycobacterium noviomagense]ORB13052.1 serine/threonine protein kinase [Mycobacterium noviomagense]BBY06210.1 serine/threonine-protein kinase PknD [Mycobacterium noviomagense]
MSGGEPGSRVGTRFGPYQLLRLLGSGGMGEVYAAEDTRKRRVVALKLISQQFTGDPVFRARLQREADIAGRLTEPHVVPIHDYGEIDGRFYVEMRLIEGTDLATLLKRDGPMSPPRAVAIVRQVAAALDAAHAVGVMHRDVKPGNILITGDDFAYLVDFGIARAATDPGLTQMGTAVGTYYYMAPERFTDDEVTYRADIYSLACVLSECLTGSPPYRAETIERLVAAHLTRPAPRPSQMRPGMIPPALDEVIAKGMAKNPNDRYNSAGELAAAAHNALTTSEQQQATTILREGEIATLRAGTEAGAADSAAFTQARGWSRAPGPVSGTGSWRSQPAAHSSGPVSRPYTREPDFVRPGPDPRDKRRMWIVLGIVAVLIVAAAGYLVTRPLRHSSTSASGQSVLPFKGLDFRLSPSGVAVDSDGNVYVSSQSMYGRVVKLAAGSSNPTVLPFSGLYQPQDVAVDSTGTVYVTDFNNRVVKLDAGSSNQIVLPFNGLNYPEGVAVDGVGNVYVADRGNDRVVKLAAGSNSQTDLPFPGLNHPDGVAVDTSGSVYVTDSDNNRVLKLPPGADSPMVLPFTGLRVPWGIAVDVSGDVYVTEHSTNKVVKLPAGTNSPTVLPFSGLNTPLAVAVDKDGNVYVADRGNNRAVKLRAS